MLWQCFVSMLRIQNQKLQGQSVRCISAFLTYISLHKPEKVQDMQSPAILELQDTKTAMKSCDF